MSKINVPMFINIIYRLPKHTLIMSLIVLFMSFLTKGGGSEVDVSFQGRGFGAARGELHDWGFKSGIAVLGHWEF